MGLVNTAAQHSSDSDNMDISVHYIPPSLPGSHLSSHHHEALPCTALLSACRILTGRDQWEQGLAAPPGTPGASIGMPANRIMTESLLSIVNYIQMWFPHQEAKITKYVLNVVLLFRDRQSVIPHLKDHFIKSTLKCSPLLKNTESTFRMCLTPYRYLTTRCLSSHKKVVIWGILLQQWQIQRQTQQSQGRGRLINRAGHITEGPHCTLKTWFTFNQLNIYSKCSFS